MRSSKLKWKELMVIAKKLKIKGRWSMTNKLLEEAIAKCRNNVEFISTSSSDLILRERNANREGSVDGYIVSCILPGVPINRELFDFLVNKAKVCNYKLLIVPVKWGNSSFSILDVPNEIREYIIETEVNLQLGSQIFYIAADLNINANALAPLTGLSGIANDRHLILPHPCIYQQTSVSVSGCKQIILSTTGTISEARHVQLKTRVASMTAFHSVLGAAILTESDYPLVFEPFGVKDRFDYLYLPDMHLSGKNEAYLKSLYTELVKADKAIGGDLFDGASLNHHERSKIGYTQNRLSIKKEIDLLRKFSFKVKELTGNNLQCIIGNHETFADRFFTGNLRRELDTLSNEDCELVLKAIAWQIANTKRTDEGIKFASMIGYFIRNAPIDIVDSSLTVGNTAIGFHGNEYLASIAGARQSNQKFVFGHVHAPQQNRNVVYVGYGGAVNPQYQSKLTKACPAHCFIDSNGKRLLKIYMP